MRVSSIRRSPRRASCARGVERQVGEAELVVVVGAERAAQQGAQPRDQLVEVERLDEVVVRAGLQSLHAVGHRVARGEHQHRYAVAVMAQPPAHLESVDVGHQHVEHHHVGAAAAHRLERLATAGRELDLVALDHQGAAQRLAHRSLVVSNQDSHAHLCP